MRLLNVWVKIHQICHVIFETANFASFFIIMTHFKLIYVLLCINGSHQSPNVETSECSCKNLPNSSCHFGKHKSVFLQGLHQFLVPSNITPVYFIRSNIIYFFKQEPIKVQNFETWVFGSKFVIFFMSILKRQVNSSSNFASYFIAMTDFLVGIKRSSQSPNFEIFQVLWWKSAIFLMPFSKPQVSFSSNFASLFRVMKYNSSALF